MHRCVQCCHWDNLRYLHLCMYVHGWDDIRQLPKALLLSWNSGHNPRLFAAYHSKNIPSIPV